MAEIKSTGTVVVEFSVAELAVVRRALYLVDSFGTTDDERPARELLADLDEVS
ncbi:hypothetical protein OG709_29995 [Streptomyces sp. NBC_01267]|uniref:hypothetical protein n=1 Tax=Streptomyces sp. NBC_01267 TaxID=2903805 RepID=UPI002E2EE685|nr:hypothetical protein [Streptomyces sp. NBC_01267]